MGSEMLVITGVEDTVRVQREKQSSQEGGSCHVLSCSVRSPCECTRKGGDSYGAWGLKGAKEVGQRESGSKLIAEG